MHDVLTYKGWIVAGVFFALFVAERAYPAVSMDQYRLRRIGKNLSFWIVNIGLSFAVVLPVSAFAAQHGLWTRPDWMFGTVGFVGDLLLLDLFLFWWHRSVHVVPFLWRFHEVHHLDEHLDTTSAIRFHFGEVFFSTFARSMVVVACAIPFSSVLVFEIMVLSFAMFHHSNIALPPLFEKALSKLIVTPSIHWVHHHAIHKDTDSNYGTVFSFWDRLFHTKSATERSASMTIGVEGKKDEALFALLTKPFHRV
jgi:sterol desaturase/sphingolipid hydroxylase (fatty acid hydroxylase superfamily)